MRERGVGSQAVVSAWVRRSPVVNVHRLVGDLDCRMAVMTDGEGVGHDDTGRLADEVEAGVGCDAMRCGQVAKAPRSSNVVMFRHAFARVSCTASSASWIEPSIRQQ